MLLPQRRLRRLYESSRDVYGNEHIRIVASRIGSELHRLLIEISAGFLKQARRLLSPTIHSVCWMAC